MNTFGEDNARSYLEKILAILDIDATVTQENVDETTICFRIDCKSDDARVLIGKNGQTLEALQFVVRQMCRSNGSQQGLFIIDILDYRTRRRRTLEEQAKRGAVAVSNGDSERFALLPMSPYDRRIVHNYLHEHFPDLASESEGDGEERHIVISFRGLPDEKGHSSEEDEEYGEFVEAEDEQEEEAEAEQEESSAASTSRD